MTASSSTEPVTVSPLFTSVDYEPALPASKSIANRALVCAALATGTSNVVAKASEHLRSVLPFAADDVEAMMRACAVLGAEVNDDFVDEHIEVTGTGGRPRRGGEQPAVVDAQRAGTVARFVLPVLAAAEGNFVLDADPQLRSRPMGDVITALRQLGASITETHERDHLPLHVVGSDLARGPVTVDTRVSSQFLSGLLLAGPICASGLRVRVDGEVAVSRPYVDMTVAVMRAFGAHVWCPAASEWIVEPTGYVATDYEVETDASAASYFWAAAAITHGTAKVYGLSRDSLQGDVAFAEQLGALGADVIYADDSITVTGPPREAGLSGGTFDFSQISDTTQTMAAVACFAQEPVTMTGVGFISAKESDRLGDTVAELAKLGVRAEVSDGALTVQPDVTELRGGLVDSHDDHRMAMAMALVGLRVAGVRIDAADCVAKSFPRYFVELSDMNVESLVRADQLEVVAVDGPAASGKSSVARRLASTWGNGRPLAQCYLDTGAMYRCVAEIERAEATRRGVEHLDADEAAELARDIDISFSYTPDVPTTQTVVANGVDVTHAIRTPAIDRRVSAVAALPAVRQALVAKQRAWIAEHTDEPGDYRWVVVEGRDIASVVAPDAGVKLFLTASHDERARRRRCQFEQESAEGADGAEARAEPVASAVVSADLVGRDAVDSTRAASPLRLAPGAVVVNTTALDFDEALAAVERLVAHEVECFVERHRSV